MGRRHIPGIPNVQRAEVSASSRRTSTPPKRTPRSIFIDSATTRRTSSARATTAKPGRASPTACATNQPSGSFARVVRNDPKQRGLLFAGTESGMYVSFDDGDHWQSLS